MKLLKRKQEEQQKDTGGEIELADQGPGQKVPCRFIFKGLQFHSKPVGSGCDPEGVAYVTRAHRQMIVLQPGGRGREERRLDT